MVFDGQCLPSKSLTECKRREQRSSNKKKAAALLREGKASEARKYLERSIDVTPEMAHQLIKACHELGVDCIVAPFEADAQLAFLSKAGIIQAVITEDSDLIPYGCDQVIFKLDINGNGRMIRQRDLQRVFKCHSVGFTLDRFRHMCILSGCDYLESLPGVGLKRATKVCRLAKQATIKQMIRNIPTYLRSRSIHIPNEYTDDFMKADYTFRFQLVFDPLERKLKPLNPYPPDVDPMKLTYAGTYVSDTEALQKAIGNLNPHDFQHQLDDFDVRFFVQKNRAKKNQHCHLRSIWDPDYAVKGSTDLTETAEEPEEEAFGTKGMESKIDVKIDNLKRKLASESSAEDSVTRDSPTELLTMYKADTTSVATRPATEPSTSTTSEYFATPDIDSQQSTSSLLARPDSICSFTASSQDSRTSSQPDSLLQDCLDDLRTAATSPRVAKKAPTFTTATTTTPPAFPACDEGSPYPPWLKCSSKVSKFAYRPRTFRVPDKLSKPFVSPVLTNHVASESASSTPIHSPNFGWKPLLKRRRPSEDNASKYPAAGVDDQANVADDDEDDDTVKKTAKKRPHSVGRLMEAFKEIDRLDGEPVVEEDQDKFDDEDTVIGNRELLGGMDHLVDDADDVIVTDAVDDDGGCLAVSSKGNGGNGVMSPRVFPASKQKPSRKKPAPTKPKKKSRQGRHNVKSTGNISTAKSKESDENGQPKIREFLAQFRHKKFAADTEMRSSTVVGSRPRKPLSPVNSVILGGGGGKDTAAGPVITLSDDEEDASERNTLVG